MSTLQSSVRRLGLVLVGALALAWLAPSPAFACQNFGRNPSAPTVTPDPNSPLTKYFVTIGGGSTFAGADPNTSKCACGLTVPAGVTVTAAAVIDPNGNPVAGFTGFLSDPNTPPLFNALQPAPGGKTWFGFSSAITTSIPNGAPSSLKFTVSAPGFADPAALALELHNGFAGSAKGDLDPNNPTRILAFDPAHRGTESLLDTLPMSATIPTLSEWGMIALVMLLVMTGGLLIRRRNNQAPIA